MSRSHTQLKTVRQLLERYQSSAPFHLYLKQYFAANRKHGSSDRRILRDLCYAYFRIGEMWRSDDMEEGVLSAYYIVHPNPFEFIQPLRPHWPVPASTDPIVRAKEIGKEWRSEDIFRFTEDLSSDIEVPAFVLSHLRQPDLFIRIRPGNEAAVIQRLNQDQIPFRQVGEHSIALGNATSLETRFQLDQEVVVQDLSSQRVSDLFALLPKQSIWRAWDACAASGGKSILLHDHLVNVELTCTDIRPAILRNLSKRLGAAAVPVIRIQSDDLTTKRDRSYLGNFDLVLADVPCTGSGTWARTPEQLSFFDHSSIDEYVSKQQRILSNILPQLAPGGYLLYMTCSAFERENFGQVEWMMQKHQLQCVAANLIKGYSMRADTMYAALLRKPID